MFEQYIRPYIENFCQKISLEDLCRIIESGKDIYPIWVRDFSNGSEKPPEFAYIFEDVIKAETKRIMAEISPDHFRAFDANPTWGNRQLDGLMNELLS